jgi:hypothetical protein
LDSGQAVPEPVTVELSCGLTTLQVIQTDLKGYFRFVLGAGVQDNMDLSAASIELPTGLDGLNSASKDLHGCEVRDVWVGLKPTARLQPSRGRR